MNEAMHPPKWPITATDPRSNKRCWPWQKEAAVTFVPHLIPANRGILATCYARLTKETSVETLHTLYTAFYENEPFVRVKPQGEVADIHHVRYSNLCDISIHVDPANRTLIAVSALDNMGKGAAGSHTEYELFCIEETAGLAILAACILKGGRNEEDRAEASRRQRFIAGGVCAPSDRITQNEKTGPFGQTHLAAAGVYTKTAQSNDSRHKSHLTDA